MASAADRRFEFEFGLANQRETVSLGWRLKGDNEVHREYQALKLSDGLVFDMQAYRQERAARRAIGAAS